MEPQVRELVRKYGGRVLYVPDRVLRERGLIRVHDLQTQRTTLANQAVHEELKWQFKRLLQTRMGYIPSLVLERINQHMQDYRSLPERYADEIHRLVGGTVQASLPPLHESWTFGNTKPTFFAALQCGEIVNEVHRHFSVVDFIISFSIGMLERNRAATAAALFRQTGGRQGKHPMLPSWPKHILRFCELAFDRNGELSPHLREEIEGYAEEHFDYTSEEKKDSALLHTRKVLSFLEERLADRASVCTRTYDVWDGNLDTFTERSWYLSFRPEEREEIAQQYFDAQSTTVSGPAREVFNRMRDTFQAQAISDEELLRREKQVNDAFMRIKVAEVVATGEFKKIPARIYFSGKFPELLRAAAAHIRERYRALGESNPEAVFVGTHKVYDFLDLPTPTATVSALKDTIDEERLRVAMQLPDAVFQSLFIGGPCSRHTFLGKSSSREDNHAGLALGRYIRERRASLS